MLRREPLELGDEFGVAVVAGEGALGTAGCDGRGIALQIYSRLVEGYFPVCQIEGCGNRPKK